MSTFKEEKRICAVCGRESTHKYISSTNTCGATDLDARPPRMYRSTMFAWLQECPECGYVAADIEEKATVSIEFLEDQRYISCDGIEFDSDLAKRFYKHYKIMKYIGDKDRAYYAALCTAWVCDDAEDMENAVRCRTLALENFEDPSKKENGASIMLIRADLLRRTGQFEQLIKEFETIRFENDMYSKIIAFQIQKAKEKDVACYTVDVAVGAEKKRKGRK